MLISMLKYIKILKGTPRTPATCIATTTPGLIVRILNSVFLNFWNYSVTLTRFRLAPWWWSVKIETCRSTFKYFYVFNIEINILDEYSFECEKVHVLVFINYE